MKILVLGSSGNFGSVLVEYLKRKGHVVTGLEKKDTLPEPLNSYDACFLALPVASAAAFIEKNEHPALIEISSVKDPMRKYSGKVISIHPMFGPKSIGNPEFQNIILVNDISPPGSSRIIRDIFPGFFIKTMSAEEHDSLMSDLLVKPYVLSMLASGSVQGSEPQISCSSYEKMLQLSKLTEEESQQAFHDTIFLNPFSKDKVKVLIEKLNRLFVQLE